ncbi:unnamed protein product [Psylliodes chrysocephalus]|uniref:Uncharacterized protein n=1 Tax=Psylliodes chrysocephalus TaxID=3402493 RepID=A0A9P0CZX3_9CUCU|nr:unnamed protein product [Psylliodes chrysocephala]
MKTKWRATLAEKEVTTLKEQLSGTNTSNNCENKDTSNMDRQSFENEMATKDKEDSVQTVPGNIKLTMFTITFATEGNMSRQRRLAVTATVAAAVAFVDIGVAATSAVAANVVIADVAIAVAASDAENVYLSLI